MSTHAVIASRVAISLFLVMAVIQLAIAVGMLPVTIVWGASQHERTLQTSLASLVAAGLLTGMAWVIHRRVQSAPPPRWIRVTSWIISCYMVLNTVGNALSTSMVERYVFGSLTVGLAVTCFVVSSSSTVAENGDPGNGSDTYEFLP